MTGDLPPGIAKGAIMLVFNRSFVYNIDEIKRPCAKNRAKRKITP